MSASSDKESSQQPGRRSESPEETKKHSLPDSYLSSAEVYAKAVDATVAVESVSTVTLLLGGEGFAGDFIVRFAGSGFVTECGFIVTAASLVTLPPIAFDFFGRFVTVVRSPAPADTAPAVIANRVFVTLTPPGCKCGFVYQAAVVGIDLTNNLAVLRIDERAVANIDKPKINCLTNLKWGKSRKYPTGSPVYTVDNGSLTKQKFNAGHIMDNKNPDTTEAFYETVDTDIMFRVAMVGAPLLDANGNVVGMITGGIFNFANQESVTTPSEIIDGGPAVVTDPRLPPDPTPQRFDPTFFEAPNGGINTAAKESWGTIDGMTFGSAEHTIKPIVRRFIAAFNGKCDKGLILVKDPVGNFFFRERAWLFLDLELNSPETFLDNNLQVAFVSSFAAGSGFTPTVGPTFSLQTPSCAALQGYYLTGGAGGSLLGILDRNDLITEMACIPLGRCGENFYSVLECFNPGDRVRLVYYKANEQYSTPHCLDVLLDTVPPQAGPREVPFFNFPVTPFSPQPP